MTQPNFGIVLNQINTDPLPPVDADFAIVGTSLPSDDADPAIFPLDKAVAVNTGDPSVLVAAGTGPLARLFARINANLADLQVSAIVVAVRVETAYNPDGTEDVAGTIANIIGDPAAMTGLYALGRAARTGYTPRLLGFPASTFPGYTGLTTLAVANPVITHQGASYTHPVVAFDPPGAAAIATVGDAGVQATAHAILGAGATAGEVTGVAINGGGQDYVTVPPVSFTGGGIGTNGVTAPAGHAVLSPAGVVVAVVIDNPGAGLTAAPTVTIGAPAGGQITAINLTAPGDYPAGTTVTGTISDGQGGAGAGAAFTFTLEPLANPLCAALPSICGKLLAHALVGGPGGSKADAQAWRLLLPDSQWLIPQDDWEIFAQGASDTYIDGVARSLGLAVRTDFQNGGYPFNAWANQPVQGALGVKREDDFSILDGANDGQELLAAGIGVTVAGDLSDGAIDDSGLVAISYRNASSNTLFNLYNKTRGRTYIDLKLIKSIRKRLGKENITLSDVDAVLNDMAVINIDLMSKGKIVGFVCKFNSADNTVEGLRAGKFTVVDNTEEAAPILVVTVNRGLDRDAIVAELEQLAAATNTVTS